MRLLRLYRHLLEAQCPKCGDPKAYVGLNDVECPNQSCSAYEPKMGDELRDESEGMTWEEWNVKHGQHTDDEALAELKRQVKRDFGQMPSRAVTDKWRFWDVDVDRDEENPFDLPWTVFKPKHAMNPSVFDPMSGDWLDIDADHTNDLPIEVADAVRHSLDIWDEGQI